MFVSVLLLEFQPGLIKKALPVVRQYLLLAQKAHGCEKAFLAVNPDDADNVLLLAEWKTREDYEVFYKSVYSNPKNMATGMQLLNDLAVEPFLRLYEVL